MKYGWLLVCFMAAMISGCGEQPLQNQESAMNTEQIKGQLMDTDRAFSRMSMEQGMLAAFFHYMAEEGLTLPKTGEPRRRGFYAQVIAEREGQGADARPLPRLTWEPLKADVATSGDLGYTHGRFEMRSADEMGHEQMSYGYYVTIWKKQPDGSWRFVFDAGNESPPPENSEAGE